MIVQTPSRREFVIAGLSAAGGLMIGAGARAATAPSDIAGKEIADPREVNAWIVIDPDDTVTVRIGPPEIGQGISTTLAMFAAEELECDWAKIEVEYASANRNMSENGVYGLMNSAGSRGLRTTRPLMQQAGASARARLIAAAAARWKVEPSSCTAAKSKVIHAPSGRAFSYGALAADAAKIHLDAEPAIKQKADFKLIGTSLPRLDTRVKTDGSAVFGLDIARPDMLYAAIALPPVIGGRLVSVDDAPIANRRGIVQVVKTENSVSVVADSFWRANEAIKLLKIRWDGGEAERTDSAQFSQLYRDLLDGEMTDVRNDGDARARLAGKKAIEAIYEVPYLAHAPMEPLNATIHLTADRLDIWYGTQAPMDGIKVAAEVSGLEPSRIHIHNCFVGGGFGRRTRSDDVRAAVAMVKASGLQRPIKVVWTREQDMRHARYRPQAVSRFKAILGPDGKPEALESRIAISSLMLSNGYTSYRFGAPGYNAKAGVERFAVEIVSNHPYRVPNCYVGLALHNTHIPVAWWRSVSGSQNSFFMESFMDELAHRAGQDPMAYRKSLVDRRDFTMVLDALEEKSAWNTPLEAKPGMRRGRGVAIAERQVLLDGSVAEVSVSDSGDIHVDRVVCVIDCSHVVNPSIVEAQVQGGVHWALSAMYYGEITVKNGAVVQGNFDDYGMVRLAQAPDVEVYTVQSGSDEYGGIGELGATTVVPAVTNAVFAATGKRITQLPIKNIPAAQFAKV